MLTIIDQISLGGFRHKANEDRVGAAGRHAWVIDGATGLGEPFMGGASDAAWLAQVTHEALTRHAELPQAALLEAMAAEITERFAAERRRALGPAWELPCGAFMLASVDDAGVSLAWTGDCRAVVDAGFVMEFGATARSEADEAGLVSRFGGGGEAAERYRTPDALAMLREMRGLMLAEGAALILCPDVSFLKRVTTARVEAPSADLLLMTDGFAAAELRYGLVAGARGMLAEALGAGLAAIASKLRVFEVETDPDSRLKPRWKRSDDASAILLKISV